MLWFAAAYISLAYSSIINYKLVQISLQLLESVTHYNIELPHTLQGRPIFIQHLGAINLKRIHELTNEERMLKFHVQEYERCVHLIMPACSKVKGSHIDQTLAIIDVKGACYVSLIR